MKSFLVILLLLVITINNFVQSNDAILGVNGSIEYDKVTDLRNLSPPQKTSSGVFISTLGLYSIGFTIGILFLALVGLLVVVYKLKRKSCESSIGDTVQIAKDDFTSTYARQISSERPYFNEENKFSLQRHNSKMTIVEDIFENNEGISKKPDVKTKCNYQKTNQPIDKLHEEIIKEICQAVIGKQQQLNEAASLSHLEEICNENLKTNQKFEKFDKSSSLPLLDVAECDEILPTTSANNSECNNYIQHTDKVNIHNNNLPFSYSKITDHIERKKLVQYDVAKCNEELPSTSANKLEPMEKHKDNADIQTEYLPFSLPKIKDRKASEKSVVNDNMNNSTSKNKTLTLAGKDDHEHIDEVYDNPSNIPRPVSQCNNQENDLDGLYDNPPTTNIPFRDRPTSSISDEHLDDIYESSPSNKPVYEKSSLTKSTEATDDTYEVPHKNSRGTMVSDDGFGYTRLYTNDKDTSFETDYINAKSLSRTNPKQL